MPGSSISLQMHTVRDFMKTPSDCANSLRKLREIGLQSIETGSVQCMDDLELARVVKGEGLSVSAYSGDGRTIVEEPGKVIEAMDKLGASYAMYPWPHSMPSDAEAYKRLAKSLEKAGAVFRKAGKVLTYHNHSIEFERFGERLGIEILFEDSDSSLLQAELDTYWVQHGGGNPAAWCRKLKGRLPRLHLKDYGISNEPGALMKPVFRELGRGSLDFKEIILAAKSSGCECFVIEQDVCPGDPFDSVKISFSYLSKLLAELEG